MNEKHITERIITDTPMSLPQAVLYGVNMNGETVELGRHPDCYSLLEADYSDYSDGLVGIALHTTGWAAPIKNGKPEGAPSQHPDRVRVALVATLTLSGYCSGIAFADGRETQYEENAPEGALWDALQECLYGLVNA